MTETERKQRWTALASSGGVCAVCGRPIIDGEPQGAHRIAKTFPMGNMGNRSPAEYSYGLQPGMQSVM